MSKCTICNSRKGKRKCLITLTFICSACCGKSRTDGSCKHCPFYRGPESERKSNKLCIEDDNQIKSLLAHGRIIQAVRLVVERTGWGLKESKDYVDVLEQSSVPGDVRMSKMANEPDKIVANKARQLVTLNKNIEAIQFVHQNTEMDLKEAKDYIDILDLEYSLQDILGDTPLKDLSRSSLDTKVRELIAKDRKVDAIKLMHRATNMSLSEANKYINTL